MQKNPSEFVHCPAPSESLIIITNQNKSFLCGTDVAKNYMLFFFISIYKKYILLCLPYDLEFEAISDIPRPPVISSNLSEFVFQPEIWKEKIVSMCLKIFLLKGSINPVICFSMSNEGSKRNGTCWFLQLNKMI